MFTDHRAFTELMRQSYPEESGAATQHQNGLPGYDGWAEPEAYRDPADRRAAMARYVLDEGNWDRLRDVDRQEIGRLAALSSPLADLYNYASYRLSQTVIRNPTTGHEIRTGPGSSWEPFTEQPGRPAVEHAEQRLRASINAVDRKAATGTSAKPPQAAPGVVPLQPGAADRAAARPSATPGRRADHPGRDNF